MQKERDETKEAVADIAKSLQVEKETAQDLFSIKSKHKIFSSQCNLNPLGPDGWQCKGSIGRGKKRKGAI